MMRRGLIFVFMFFLLLSVPVCALESSPVVKDVPEEIRGYVPEEALSGNAEDFLAYFTAENAFKTVIGILGDVFPDAMAAFFSLLGLLMISAVIGAMRDSLASPAFAPIPEFVSVACTAGAAFGFMQTLFEEFQAFVSQVNGFMRAVIPVMSTLMISCGEATSAAVFGGALSASVMLLESVCTSLLMPMLSALLCVYTVSGLCAGAELSGFGSLLKNITAHTLSAVMAVMSCVLAFQSVIAKSADTAAVKGVKFVLGNAVPIVGGALADAAGTVASSMGLVRSATGITGAVVLCTMFAVPALKFLVWKAVLDAASAVASSFSLKRESDFFSNVSGVVGFITAVTASIAVFFIIALTAVSFGGVK